MTYNTPNGVDDRRLWCPRCQLSVEPSTAGDGPQCPACGGDL